MTDFAAASLKICGISYCLAVKIFHGQHSSNIVITFLTPFEDSSTIKFHRMWQAPTPDSKALTLIAHVHLGDVCIYIKDIFFRGFANLQYISFNTFPVRCQIEIY